MASQGILKTELFEEAKSTNTEKVDPTSHNPLMSVEVPLNCNDKLHPVFKPHLEKKMANKGILTEL